MSCQVPGDWLCPLATMLVILLKILVPLLVILQLLPLLIWLERKGSAYIQDRTGPNRASIMGIRLGGVVHSLADVVKLMFKEEIIPTAVNRPFYIAAPMIALFVACVTFLVIPFGDTLMLDSGPFTMMAADLNVGILYLLAMASLGVYSVMLAGWSSNNKYALLGGVRSSAQMISYELSMGLSLLAVVLMSGSLNLNQMVQDQSAMVWGWNVVLQPVAALIFIISSFAETNRAPFDLPEGESELVAGYHTEYSSMKFAMFFMAEYLHMVIASALIVTLFFGGWQVPFVSTLALRDHADILLKGSLLVFGVFSLLAGVFLMKKFRRGRYGDKRDYEVLVLGFPAFVAGLALLALPFVWPLPALTATGAQVFAGAVQFLTFVLKILFMCWVFIWVRWTLPRFRYDHLMTLGWKYLLPLAIANLFVTALVMLL